MDLRGVRKIFSTLGFLILFVFLIGINPSSAQYFPGGLGNTNLQLWLNANTAYSLNYNGLNQLSSWGDLSGNGFNFSQSTSSQMPVFNPNSGPNSRPGISFTASSNQFLSSPNIPSSISFANGVSTFTVVSFGSSGSNARVFDFGNGASNDNILIARNGTSSNYNYGVSYGGLFQNSQTSSNPIGANNLLETVQSGGLAGSLSPVSFYSSGANQTSSIGNTYIPKSINRTSNFLGKSNWPADAYFNGTMSEILLYNSALNTTQRVILENYLSAEWGLPITSPKFIPPSSSNFNQNLVGIGYTSPTDNFLNNLTGTINGSTNGMGFSSGSGAGDFLNSSNPGYIMAADNNQSSSVIIGANLPGIGNNITLWNRSWYIMKSGGNPNGKITINFNFQDYNGGSTSALVNYEMMFNPTDGTFNSGTNSLMGVAGVVSGNTVSFTLPASSLLSGYYTLIYPITSIAYIGSPFCTNGITSVIQKGLTGGTYSSSAGLSLNSITGDINLSTSTPGNYTIVYTYNGGASTCNTNITLSAYPSLIITNPVPACNPNTVDITSAYITAGSTAGISLSYFKDSLGTIPLLNPAAINTSGTYYIQGKIAASGCFSIKPVQVVISGLAPTVAFAGNNQTLCNITSGTLAGNTATTGTGIWTQVSGPNTAILSNPSSPNCSISGLVSGNYVFQWTISTGSCLSSYSQVTISVGILPNIYSLSGGGHYCASGSGLNIGLSGSQTGVNYQIIPANGLLAQYYNNYASTGAGSPTGSVVVSRLENTLNDIYVSYPGASGFPAGVNLSNTETIWTGSIIAPVTGTYTFTTISDDGINLNINGTTLINNWTSHGATTDNGTINLVAGQIYPIRVAYYNLGGPAELILEWSYPGQPTQVIPNSQLLAAAGNGSILPGTGAALNFPNITAQGVYTVIATNQGNACSSAMSGNVMVIADAVPSPSNAGANQYLCSVNSGTLAGNNPLVGTGIWTQVSGPNASTITNPSAFNSTITGLVPGTYVYQWTISNGLCTSNSSQVSINVGTSPTVYALTGNAEFCQSGSTTIKLSGSQVGVNYQLISNGLTAQYYNNFAGSGTALPTGSPVLTITEPTVNDVFSGYPGATGFPNGVNSSNIEGIWTGYVVAPVTGTYTFTTISDDGVYLTVNGNNLINNWTGHGATVDNGTISLVAGQVYPIRLSYFQGGGPCEIVLEWSYPGQGTQIIPTTFLIPQNSTNPIIAGTGSPISFANITTPGTYTVLATNPISNCVSIMSGTVNFIIDQPPTVSNAGPNQYLCSTTIGTLAGNYPSSGTGLWTQVSGPNTSTITNPTSSNSGITGLIPGTYVYQWTITAGLCGNSSSQVTVSVGTLPNIYTLSGNSEFCNAGSITMNLSGSQIGVNYQLVPNGLTAQYYNGYPATGSALPNGSPALSLTEPTVNHIFAGYTGSTGFPYGAPSTNVEGLWTGYVIAPVTGTYTFTTISDDGVYLTVNGNNLINNWTGHGTTIDNGTINLIAGQIYPIRLAYFQGGGGAEMVLEWSYPGQATQVIPTTFLVPAVSTNPVVAGTGSALSFPNITVGGTYSVLATNPITNCLSIMTGSASLKIDPIPTNSNAGPNQYLCSVNSTSLAANIPTAGTGLWTQVSGPNASTIANPSLANTTITGLIPGVYIYQWTISSGICTASTSQVTISVGTLPNIYTVSGGAEFCQAGTTTINLSGSDVGVNYQLISNGLTAQYYNNYAASGTALPTGSPVLIRTESTVNQIFNGYAGAVGFPPGVNASNIEGIWTGYVIAPVTGTYTFTTISDDGVYLSVNNTNLINNWTSHGATTDNGTIFLTAGQIYPIRLAYFQGGGPCEIILEWSYPGQATQIIPNSFLVPQGSPNPIIPGTGSALSFPNISTGGVYTILATNPLTNCLSIMTGTATLKIDSIPTTSNAGPNQYLCSVSSGTLAGNTPTSGQGTWTQVSGPNTSTISYPHSPNSPITGLTQGIYVYQWTIDGRLCGSSSSQVSIYVGTAPTVYAISGSAEFCQSGSTTIYLSGSQTGINYQLIANGLTAQYYTNYASTPTANPVGSPLLTQTEATVNDIFVGYTGAVGFPNPLPSSNIEGIWTGYVVAPITATYTFSTISDDGVYLTVNGQNLINNWTGHGATQDNGTISLVAGQVYPIQLKYFQGGGGAEILLEWSYPGQPTQVIPTNYLIPQTSANPIIAGTGSPLSFPNITTSGNYTILATNPISNCVSIMSGTVNFIIDPLPTVSNAGANQYLCSVTSGTLAGNIPTAGTGLWTQVSGPNSATIISPSSAGSTITGLIQGSYVFQWTISSGLCTASTSQVTINVGTAPNVYTVGGSAEYCSAGSTNITLSGSQTGINYQLVANGLTAQYYTNIAATGAGSPTGSPLLTQTEATVNDSYVGYANAVGFPYPVPNNNVEGIWTGYVVAPITGIYTFSTISDDGVYLTVNGVNLINNWTGHGATQDNGTISLVAGQVYPIRLSYFQGGGGAILQLLWSYIGQPQQIIPTTYLIPQTSTNPIQAGTGSPLTFPNISTGGNYTILATNPLSNCVSVMSGNAILKIDPIPTVSNAGANEYLCSVTSGNLNGNIPTAGTGTWTQVSGPNTASIMNPNLGTTTITGLVQGTYVFQWTISSGLCTSSTSQVSVYVGIAPNVYTVSGSAEYCVTGSTSFNLSGSQTGVNYQLVANGLTAQYYNNYAATGAGTPNGTPVLTQIEPTVNDIYIGYAGATGFPAGAPSSNVEGIWTGYVVAPFTGTYTFSTISDDGVYLNINGVNLINNWTGHGATQDNGTIYLVAGQIYPIRLSYFQGGGSAILQLYWAYPGQPMQIIPNTYLVPQNSTNPILAGTGSPLSFPNISTAGNYTILATNPLSNCVSIMSGSASLKLDPIPTVSNAGPNQYLCSVTNGTLAGNTPVTGTGTWTQISGPNASTITNPNSPNSTITGLVLGTYVYQWTISSGVCTSSTSQVSIFIGTSPNIYTVTGNAEYCQSGSTTINLSGSQTGVNYQLIANGLTAQYYNNYAATGAGMPTGSPVLTQTELTVNDIYTGYAGATGFPTGVNASNMEGIWSGYVVAPVTGSYTFSTTSDDGVYLTINGTNIINDWTVHGATIDNGTINLVAGQLYPIQLKYYQSCCGSEIILQWSYPGQTTQVIPSTFLVPQGATFPVVAGTGSPLSFTNITTAATYTILATNSVSNCVSIMSGTATLKLDPLPTVSNAGPNQNLCGLTTATLAGNTPLIGTGLWAEVSGPNSATIANPSLANSGLSGLIPGNYVFSWTITSGVCTASTSKMTLLINPSPDVSFAGNNQNLCNVTNTVLAGNNPVNGTGTWTLVSGPNTPTITNPLAYNSGITGMISGTYVFRWTITNGTCTASFSTVSITISPNPTLSNAGANQNLCNLSTTVLSGNPALSGSGLWTLVSGPNTPTITSPSVYNTSVTGLIPGLYTFQWTISSGACTASTSTVNITISASPTLANAGPNQNLCNVNSATLAGNNPSSGTGTWSWVSGPNTPTINNPNAYNSSLSGLTLGSYVFKWTISNGACAATSSTVNLVISPTPTLANAGANQNLCNVTSTTLAGNNPSGGTGTWSWISGPNTPTITNPSSYNSTITGMVSGTYVFQWSISSGACAVSNSTVSINISNPPTASAAGANQNLCNVSSTNLSGNNPGIGTGKWTLVSGPNIPTITNPTNNNTGVSGMVSGTYVFAWTITSGSCTASSSTVSVLISPSPTPSNAGLNQSLCNSTSTTLSANNPVNGSGLWSLVSGPNTPTITNPTAYNSSLTGLVSGTYILTWTVSSGACTSSSSNVAIQVAPSPSLASAGPYQNICNVSTTQLAGNNPVSGSGIWTLVLGPNTPVITNPTAYNSTVTGLIPGNYVFQWNVSSGSCTVSTSQVTVVVGTNPTIFTLSGGGSYCTNGAGATLKLSGSQNGVNYQLVPVGLTAQYYNNYALTGSGSPIGNPVLSQTETTVNDIYFSYPGATGVPAGVNNSNFEVIWTGYLVAPVTGNYTFTTLSDDGIYLTVNGVNLIDNWTNHTATTDNGSISLVAGQSYPIRLAYYNLNNSAEVILQWSYPGQSTQIIPSTQFNTQGPGLITIPGNGNAQVISNITTPGTYYIYATNAGNSCSSVMAGSATVIASPPPSVSNAGTNQSLCNTSSATLAGNNPLAGTGLWTLVSGPNIPVITNPSANNSTVTGMISGNYVFQWTISSGACTASTSTVSLSVAPTPTVSNAGTNQSLCNTSSATLAGNNPISGSGLWTLVSGPNIPVITNPSAYNSSVTGMVSGNYVFMWTISSGTCTASSSMVTLSISPNPTVSNAGTNQSLCNVSSTTLAANNPVNGAGNWTLVSGPNTPLITNPLANNSTVTGMVPGTYVFMWTISSGACSLSTSSVSVSIAPSPTVSNAGTAQSLCNVSTANLAGNVPSFGSGLWTLVSGPNAPMITDPTANNSSVTGMVSGNYVFMWTISSGSCLSSSSTVSISIAPTPTVSNAGTNQSLCNVSSTRLAGNNPIAGSGLWTLVSGPNIPVIANPSAYNSSLMGLVSGTYVFQWTISSGSCSASVSTVTLTIAPSPSVADAGTNQSLCNVTQSTLAANNPISGTGLWTLVSGPNIPVIINPSSYNSSLSGLISGNYVFQWTISSGACSASTSTVNLSIAPSPTLSDAGSNQSLCNTTTTTLSGNNPVAGSGLWTLVSGPNVPVITDPSAYNSGVSGMVSGNYVFMWTISSGSCTASTSTVSISISPNPTPSNAGTNQSLCNMSSTSLAANNPGFGTGIWTLVSGPNTPLITNPLAYNTTVTAMLPGTYVFNWTISSGTCTSSNSTVSIQVFPSPDSSNAGANQNLCNVSSTILSANNPINGKGIWTLVSGPNTPVFADSSLANTAVNGLSFGTYVLKWTINSGPCMSNSSTLSLVNSPVPDISNAGINQNLCNIGTTQLSANNPVNGIGLWTQISGPPSSITHPNSANTTITGLSTGTFVYQWTISSGNCASSTSQVSIVISPYPSLADAGPDQNLCNVNSTILSAKIPSSGNGTWTQVSGAPTMIANPNSPNTGISGLSAGTYIYQWTVASGLCALSSSQIVVSVIPLPSQSIAGPDQVLNCSNVSTITLSGNQPLVGSGTWTQVSGPSASILSNPNQNNTTVSGLISGNYVFQWTISNGVCASSTSTVNITVPNPITFGISSVNDVTCFGGSNGGFTISATGGTGNLSYSLDNGLNYQASNIFTGLKSGNYIVLVKDSKGCLSSVVQIIIHEPQPVQILTHSIQIKAPLTADLTQPSATAGTLSGLAFSYYLDSTVSQPIIHPESISRSGTYYIKGTNGTGCMGISPIKVSISPVANPDTANTSSNTPINIFPLTNDFGWLNPKSLVFTSPSHGTANITASGQITYTPALDFVGMDQWQYTICDSTNPGALCASTTITVFVKGQNPIIHTQSYVLNSGSVLKTSSLNGLLVGEKDPQGESLQTTLITQPLHGSLTLNLDGTFTYTVGSGFSGLDSLKYNICNTSGQCSSAEAYFTVNPTAVNDTLKAIFNTPLMANILSNDLGNLDYSSLKIQSNPVNGSLSVNPVSGMVTYVPNSNYYGIDSFTYTICDKTKPLAFCSNIGKVIIQVKPKITDLAISLMATGNINTDTYKYTLLVQNFGPDTATQVIIRDTLPEGLIFQSTNALNYTYNSTTNILSISLPVLPNGALDSIFLTVSTKQLGSITNSVGISGQDVDLNQKNNFASLTISKSGEILFFPTLFTPNGDGFNDNFIIRGLEDYPDNELQIFNRWGNQVYHAGGYMTNGRLWDGANLTEGTYYYVLKVNMAGIERKFWGFTTLIRN